MAFKNPSLIASGISKEEFEILKEQVEKNTHDIEQMKKQESVIYNKDEQEYIIKKETPNAAFLTSIPRILEIVIAPKEHE